MELYPLVGRAAGWLVVDAPLGRCGTRAIGEACWMVASAWHITTLLQCCDSHSPGRS
jgi:hypothetical protein